MQSTEFVAHCQSLNQKHFGGEAEMSPKWPFIRREVRSYYGNAKRYNGGWQVKIAWCTMDLPDWVRDYIICHELAHCVDDSRRFGAMHTSQFWALLRAAYPRTDEAEAYLRRRDRELVSGSYQFRPYKEPNGDLKRRYPVGTDVYYQCRDNEYTGTVMRHNHKTITISTDNPNCPYRWWRIPWGELEQTVIEIF